MHISGSVNKAVSSFTILFLCLTDEFEDIDDTQVALPAGESSKPADLAISIFMNASIIKITQCFNHVLRRRA